MTDYDLIIEQMRALAEISADPIPVMANVSALLFHDMEQVNWAGFYLVKDGALLLGPFQGKVACVRIEKGRGVRAGDRRVKPAVRAEARPSGKRQERGSACGPRLSGGNHD